MHARKPPPSAGSPAADASARERILKSARRHFFAHGFRGVTMDDLAVEMGMSKKTLYAHFASKMALLKAVMLGKISEIDAAMESVTAEASLEFPQILQKLLACLQKHASEIQPAFARDLSKEAPELVDLLLARRRKIIQRTFGRVLTVGRASRLVRSDIPIEFLIEILLGAAEAIVTPQKLAERGATPLECISPILSVFLHGVLTETGRSQVSEKGSFRSPVERRSKA
jgi:AcrR family transcriptional regulator